MNFFGISEELEIPSERQLWAQNFSTFLTLIEIKFVFRENMIF